MYYDYAMGAPVQQQRLLNMIMEAMKDERHDRQKYGDMMKMTDDKEIKQQINFAYEDEAKHYQMFRQLYRQLTGTLPREVPVPPVKKYDSLVDAVKDSINGELEAVEFYRKIYFLLTNKEQRDMLYEIITDEQEHATRFVYVYSMLKGK